MVNYKIADVFDNAKYEILTDVAKWNNKNPHSVGLFSGALDITGRKELESRYDFSHSGGSKYKLVRV